MAQCDEDNGLAFANISFGNTNAQKFVKASKPGGVESAGSLRQEGGQVAKRNRDEEEEAVHRRLPSSLLRRKLGWRLRLRFAWQSGQRVRLPGMPESSPNPQLRQPGVLFWTFPPPLPRMTSRRMRLSTW